MRCLPELLQGPPAVLRLPLVDADDVHVRGQGAGQLRVGVGALRRRGRGVDRGAQAMGRAAERALRPRGVRADVHAHIHHAGVHARVPHGSRGGQVLGLPSGVGCHNLQVVLAVRQRHRRHRTHRAVAGRGARSLVRRLWRGRQVRVTTGEVSVRTSRGVPRRRRGGDDGDGREALCAVLRSEGETRRHRRAHGGGRGG